MDQKQSLTGCVFACLSFEGKIQARSQAIQVTQGLGRSRTMVFFFSILTKQFYFEFLAP